MKIGRELVSIIVPIYNVEAYLPACIKSIQNQTYTNLEIILVNDGSVDGSADICEKTVCEDGRFKLVTKENQGLGMARNTGIDNAVGDYICFIDADDFIHNSYVEILVKNLQEHGADISACGYVKFEDKPERDPESLYKTQSIYKPPEVLDKTDIIKDISTTGPDNKSERLVIACNKLFRKELFQSLRFVNKLHEDEFMITELILIMNKMVFTEDVLYFYRQHGKSITGKENSYDLRHLDHLDAVYIRLQAFSGETYRNIFPMVLNSYFENSIIMLIMLTNKDNKSAVRKKIYPRFIKTIFRYGIHLPKRRILKYFTFLASPDYYRKQYWD